MVVDLLEMKGTRHEEKSESFLLHFYKKLVSFRTANVTPIPIKTQGRENERKQMDKVHVM